VVFWKKALTGTWKQNAERVHDNPKVINKGYISPFHKLENYMNPTSSVKERNHTLRDIKNKTMGERHELRKIIDHENPKSSKEKIDSLVFQRMFGTIREEFKKQSKISNEHENNENILKDIGDYDEKFVEGVIDKIKLGQTKREAQEKAHDGEEMRTKQRVENKTFEQRKVDLALREIEDKERSKFVDTSLLARLQNDPLVSGQLPKDYFKENPVVEKKVIDELTLKMTADKKKSLSPLKTHKKQTINYIKSVPQFSASKWMKTDFHHPGVYTVFNEQADKKNGHAWSCCLDYNFDSRGCQKKVTNKMKWNLDPI